MSKEELNLLLNSTNPITLNFADDNSFSFSVDGKCVTISAFGGLGHNEGLGYLEYSIDVEDT